MIAHKSVNIVFALIGAILALLPAYVGDLRILEQLLLAPMVGGLPIIFGIFWYNFLTLKKRNTSVWDKVVASATGAILCILFLAFS